MGEDQPHGQAQGCTGGTPSLTIFSAAVLLMKRDPCPGLPVHFTFIPAAAGVEGRVEQKAWDSISAPAPRRAKDRAVDTQILTPWAPLTIEDTEGVRWAGQACGGHRQRVSGTWRYRNAALS